MQRLEPRLDSLLRPAQPPRCIRVAAEAAAAAAVSYASYQLLDAPSQDRSTRVDIARLGQPYPVLPLLTQRDMRILEPLLAYKSTDWWFEESLQRIGEGEQLWPGWPAGWTNG